MLAPNVPICWQFCLLRYTGERELVEFLNDEIAAEKQAIQKVSTELDGFKVTFDGANVELSKQIEKEK